MTRPIRSARHSARRLAVDRRLRPSGHPHDGSRYRPEVWIQLRAARPVGPLIARSGSRRSRRLHQRLVCPVCTSAALALRRCHPPGHTPWCSVLGLPCLLVRRRSGFRSGVGLARGSLLAGSSHTELGARPDRGRGAPGPARFHDAPAVVRHPAHARRMPRRSRTSCRFDRPLAISRGRCCRRLGVSRPARREPRPGPALRGRPLHLRLPPKPDHAGRHRRGLCWLAPNSSPQWRGVQTAGDEWLTACREIIPYHCYAPAWSLTYIASGAVVLALAAGFAWWARRSWRTVVPAVVLPIVGLFVGVVAERFQLGFVGRLAAEYNVHRLATVVEPLAALAILCLVARIPRIAGQRVPAILAALGAITLWVAISDGAASAESDPARPRPSCSQPPCSFSA